MLLVLLAPLIAALVIGGALLGLNAQRRRQLRIIGQIVETPTPADRTGGRPSILFFTGEACTICHTAQRPALDVLAEQIDGQATIREIDIAIQPELARSYRVMSLPTTIVLDIDGAVCAVNVGFAPAEKLRGQLTGAGVLVAA